MSRRNKIIILSIAGSILAGLALTAFIALKSSNTGFSQDQYLLYIKTGTDMAELEKQLIDEHVIKSATTYGWCAQMKRFKNVKPGRYKIKRGASNTQIVNMLRSGDQSPVQVRLDGTKTLADLAGKLGKNMEHDSMYFAAVLLNEDTAAAYGYNIFTFSSLIFGDTYDFFWNMSARDFLMRMKESNAAFWTEQRQQQCAKLGLSETEVCTLASIVRGETARLDEAPKIAGLYLNRLKTGMKLQADPTVIFAMGNTEVQRVYHTDLSNSSPYNTYEIVGLPPGPISLPETRYIDAVLNAEAHNYIYMCAKPDGSGYHNFAVSYEQHLQNAAEYHRRMDELNIHR